MVNSFTNFFTQKIGYKNLVKKTPDIITEVNQIQKLKKNTNIINFLTHF